MGPYVAASALLTTGGVLLLRRAMSGVDELSAGTLGSLLLDRTFPAGESLTIRLVGIAVILLGVVLVSR